jgi:Glyoxalase-like domain
MATKLNEVVVDCNDPLKLAKFWGETLSSKVEDWSTEEEAGISEGLPLPILFIKVPEGKSVKNRLHFDVTPETTIAVEIERLSKLGARQFEAFPNWTVMQDPEGNEFCILKNQQERDAG